MLSVACCLMLLPLFGAPSRLPRVDQVDLVPSQGATIREVGMGPCVAQTLP